MPLSVKSQQKQRSTSRSFWEQLQSNIDITGKRAKHKIQYSSRLRNSMPKNVFQSTPFTVPTNQSINSIRSKITKQRQIQQSIKNRAHYVNIQKDRKVQTAQLARQKYQKVKQIRSQSFRQKTQSKKLRSSYLDNYLKQVSSKVIKVKNDDKSKQSMQRIKSAAKSQAQRIRILSLQNQKKIKAQQQRSVQKNKRQVLKTQMQEQKSKKKLQTIKKNIIQKGKQNHYLKKAGQYDVLKTQQAKNNQLLYKVQSRLSKIQAQKEKADQQLKSFQSFLKIGRQRFSNNSRPRSHSSFYITNV